MSITILNAAGLAQMDSRKALEPYVVARTIKAGDKAPIEVARTKAASGRDPSWRGRDATFTLSVPVYKSCDVIFVIYDYDTRRGKHLACGQIIVLGSDLLNEDADPIVTRSLIAMGAKQVAVAGTLSFKVGIDDANNADIGVEVLCACANGSVDHALVFSLPRMPPPDPVIEVDAAPILEKARVLHDRRHEHHDELNLVYNDTISVLKKLGDGWWYGKRVVWNTRNDRSWFEEGWFPASYVTGDRWLQRQTGDHWVGDADDDFEVKVVGADSQDTSLLAEDASLEGTISLGSHGVDAVLGGIEDLLSAGIDDDLFEAQTKLLDAREKKKRAALEKKHEGDPDYRHLEGDHDHDTTASAFTVASAFAGAAAANLAAAAPSLAAAGQRHLMSP